MNRQLLLGLLAGVLLTLSFGQAKVQAAPPNATPAYFFNNSYGYGGYTPYYNYRYRRGLYNNYYRGYRSGNYYTPYYGNRNYGAGYGYNYYPYYGSYRWW